MLKNTTNQLEGFTAISMLAGDHAPLEQLYGRGGGTKVLHMIIQSYTRVEFPINLVSTLLTNNNPRGYTITDEFRALLNGKCWPPNKENLPLVSFCATVSKKKFHSSPPAEYPSRIQEAVYCTRFDETWVLVDGRKVTAYLPHI